MVSKIKAVFKAAFGWIGGANTKVDELQSEIGRKLDYAVSAAQSIIDNAHEEAFQIVEHAKQKATLIKNAVDTKVDDAQEEASEVGSMLDKATDEEN